MTFCFPDSVSARMPLSIMPWFEEWLKADKLVHSIKKKQPKKPKWGEDEDFRAVFKYLEFRSFSANQCNLLQHFFLSLRTEQPALYNLLTHPEVWPQLPVISGFLILSFKSYANFLFCSTNDPYVSEYKKCGLKRDFSNFSVYKSPGEIINMRVPIQ